MKTDQEFFKQPLHHTANGSSRSCSKCLVSGQHVKSADTYSAAAVDYLSSQYISAFLMTMRCLLPSQPSK